MTAVESRWRPAQHLILGDDLLSRVCAEISAWLQEIELFRKGEDQRMLLQTPTPEDLAVHKRLLQQLIADGQHLQSLVRQLGLSENSGGISAESLAATVELLQADYCGWHEPMPTEQREQFMREVFPDVA